MLFLKALETFEEEMLQTITPPPTHHQPGPGNVPPAISTPPTHHQPGPENVPPAMSTPPAHHQSAPVITQPSTSTIPTHSVPDPTTVQEPVIPSTVLDDLKDDISGCTHTCMHAF